MINEHHHGQNKEENKHNC